MKKAHLLLFLSMLYLTMGSESQGQVRQGMNELNMAGSLDVLSSEGESLTLLNIGIATGHFVMPNIEIGTTLSLTKFDDEKATGAAGSFVSYHFQNDPGSRIVPFITGQVGLGYGNNDNPTIVGLAGGIKVFVAGGGGAFTFQPFMSKQFYKDGSLNHFGVSYGVSIFL